MNGKRNLYFQPEKYEAFRYVKNEDMETLMICAAARILPFPKGTVFSPGEWSEQCALILKGDMRIDFENGQQCLLMTGGVFGAGFLEEEGVPIIKGAEAVSDCVLLVMSQSGAMVPCWFSCNFHGAFSENLSEINRRQMILLKEREGTI